MGRTADIFSIPEYRVRLSVENALMQRIVFYGRMLGYYGGVEGLRVRARGGR